MDFTLSGAAVFETGERLQYDLPRFIAWETYEAGLHANAIREVATSVSRDIDARAQLGRFTPEQQERASLLASRVLEFYNMAAKVRSAILAGKQVPYTSPMDE
jgi:hypothetical protein